MVAICGPQASAQVELGPQFETTFDRKKADFAMALGTFYCRHLQAPIMATVEREGVVYANVYDLRGGRRRSCSRCRRRKRRTEPNDRPGLYQPPT